MKNALVALVLFLGVTSTAFGAVFVVPDDAELVHKSSAIVAGRVASATARVAADGTIETVYRLHVDRRLKGLTSGSIDVVSPGGEADGKFLAVQGAAHFSEGDRVLLFLTLHKGEWTPTDMTVGKFRFVTSTGGQSLLVRDEEDIVGFDRDLRPHVEKVRRQDEFLRYIAEVVRGGRGAATQSYFVDTEETLAYEPQTEPKGFDLEADSSHAASTYSIKFTSGGTLYPGRWPSTRMTASLARPFFKSSAQNATGLGDGGVGQITSMLAAWTNDCPSAVNVTYGGTSANLKNPGDNVNVVVYNDPGSHIAGAWSGSGVIATAYMSGDAFHTFDGVSWVSLSDSDIVVQNGLSGAESFMATAMTHETGHAIGLRHSNTKHDGTACTAAEECTSSAIMNSSVGTLYGFTPQSWDLTAIRKIYPTTCTPPVTAGARYDHNGDGKADIYWRNLSSGRNWIYMMNGNLVASSLATRDEANLQWKIVSINDFNGDGRSDVLWRNSQTGGNYMYLMNGATATGQWVNYEQNLNWKIVATGDFNGDGKADIYWRNTATGINWIYMMNGHLITQSVATRNEGVLAWEVMGSGDFNGDGRDDIFWRNNQTGGNYIYLMNGATASGSGTLSMPLAWKVAGFGDLNGDGRDDVVWRNESTGQNSVFLMNGATATNLAINTEANLLWKIANVADYSGDGKADILWRNSSTGGNWLYRMNGNLIAASQSVQAEPDLNWTIQK